MSDQDIINAALAAQARERAKLYGIPTVPVKQQISIANGSPVVVHVKPGLVTFFDKVKKYYTAIIAITGAFVVIFAQLQNIIPDGQVKEIVTLITVSLVGLGVSLKKNEHWFDSEAPETPETPETPSP